MVLSSTALLGFRAILPRSLVSVDICGAEKTWKPCKVNLDKKFRFVFDQCLLLNCFLLRFWEAWRPPHF